MIHALAHYDGSGQIGEGTKVWQFASIIRGSTIGRDCTIASCAIIDGAAVGDDSIVSHGASINPGTVIGNGVFVGPNVTICNDMWPSADKEGYETPKRSTVVIENGASIGAGAVILPGVRIGKNAVVAAGAVVKGDVPPGYVYRRNDYKARKPDDWHQRRMRYVA
ncbi:DapH/DapD/GlmU-related protein [Mesorhizobium sp. CA8]|uniref:DapH/DapD/GlmU-related protein n=1 Tax=Mesorhizobium sp. CA8 TaxID=2876637 RepID=UPI0021E26826|nr:DapH/DapD/GlmU-related protein [Mesorhizobium sp. CA8]